MRRNRTNIDEVVVYLVGCWLLLERRKSRKNLSRAKDASSLRSAELVEHSTAVAAPRAASASSMGFWEAAYWPSLTSAEFRER